MERPGTYRNPVEMASRDGAAARAGGIESHCRWRNGRPKEREMSERQIHVTSQDRKRLQLVERMATDAGDRGDLMDLAEELRNATVVDPSEIPPDVITMKSKVRLLDVDENETYEYTLVYPQEANYSEGKISIVAPIGAAMLGYRVGDLIEWEVPSGRRRLRVEALLYQPEAAGDYNL